MNAHAEINAAVADAYNTNTYVYVDIETIPCQSPEYRAEVAKGIAAPATYKKPESIAAWLDENREAATDEAVAKTSFDGGRGHVCTIAWAKNDGAVRVEHAESLSGERAVIEAFFGDLDKYHSETIVGHNIAAFDLAFLRKRAIVLGITLPGPTAFPRDPKPWDRAIFDTMTAWAGARDRISMDNLCSILGIPGKDGFDGSQVAEAWANGEHDRIAEYCASDVDRTRAIHQRFLAAGW